MHPEEVGPADLVVVRVTCRGTGPIGSWQLLAGIRVVYFFGVEVDMALLCLIMPSIHSVTLLADKSRLNMTISFYSFMNFTPQLKNYGKEVVL